MIQDHFRTLVKRTNLGELYLFTQLFPLRCFCHVDLVTQVKIRTSGTLDFYLRRCFPKSAPRLKEYKLITYLEMKYFVHNRLFMENN